MQGSMPSQLQEPICINVDKVFDWIVKEASFEFSPTGSITFPGVTATTSLAGAVVTCNVVPRATNPVVILNRENRQFTIDGATVCLQNLTIQKNFTLTLVVTYQMVLGLQAILLQFPVANKLHYARRKGQM